MLKVRSFSFETYTIKLLLSAIASVFILLFFFTALSRIAYPYALEWVEANTFVHTLRVVNRQPLYIPPSFEFTPTIYPPLYYYLSSLYPKNIMLSMRLVSLLSTIAIFIMIYKIGRSINLDPVFSFGAVGLFAASYSVTGFWFDVARVDMLFLAFIAGAYTVTICHKSDSTFAGLGAGFLNLLAFFTKQNALAVVPFITLYLLLKRQYKRLIAFICSFVILFVFFVFYMNGQSKGWFWFYIFDIPNKFNISWQFFYNTYWTKYILPRFWPVVMLILISIGFSKYRNLDFTSLFVIPLFLISILPMSHQWGWINNLVPASFCLSILGMEGFQYIYSHQLEKTKTTLQSWRFYIASILLIVQFINLLYDPRLQIPLKKDYRFGEKIIAVAAKSEPPVYIPTAPYFLSYSNLPAHVQTTSLGDLYLAAKNDPQIATKIEPYLKAINRYVEGGNIQTAIIPSGSSYASIFSAENGYKCRKIFPKGQSFRTITGAISTLDSVCRRVDSANYGNQ